jgi:gamma-glutamylcyclotransferase (GGCT)/AIG2-like uncharacterized protein YtfP
MSDTINLYLDTKRTVQGNELIAKFMDVACEYHKQEEILYVQQGENTHTNGAKTPCLKIARYHTSWDWLMPVISKIEKLYETKDTLPGFNISGHGANYSAGGFRGEAAAYPEGPKPAFNSRIEAAWYVVVEFIKWWKMDLATKKKGNKMHRFVAVYGTLRKEGGDPDFRRRAGLTEATLVSVERIPGFKLVNRVFNFRDIPIIIRTVDRESSVKVEIHKISQDQLTYMDRQEGIDSADWFYKGSWIETKDKHIARLYEGKESKVYDHYVEKGDWIAYINRKVWERKKMKQKFRKLTFVYICKEMPSYMDHFDRYNFKEIE